MSIDPFTARNPSYCFVELETKEQAQNAMKELNGKRILDRPVKIKPGVPKSHGNRFNGRETISMHDDENSPGYAFDRWERTDATTHWTAYTEDQRLYVGGLPRFPTQLEVNHEMIKLFNGFTMSVTNPTFVIHSNFATAKPLVK
jgi:RNA recognition motif-containing protein